MKPGDLIPAKHILTDAKVLTALHNHAFDDVSLRRMCLILGMNWTDFRRSLFRLAIRQPHDDPRRFTGGA